MFTQRELTVLHSALLEWKGPYTNNEKLTPREKCHQLESIRIAGSLIDRFEEILQHYYEMENSHMA